MVISIICFPLSYKLSKGVSSVYVLKRTSETFRTCHGQHSSKSPPYIGFDFVLKYKCNIFVIVKFVYVQVNETQEYVHDSLNTATVVVLEVLFPYGFIYEMGPPMLENRLKNSQSRAVPPLFTQVRVEA